MQTEKIINKLIKQYNLKPHVEGGLYIRHYESKEDITRDGNIKCKSGSAIYYLLEKNDISKFHKISSDELWHFYSGGLLELNIITQDNKYIVKYLGNSLIYKEASFCVTVEKGSIFSAKVIKGEYVLTGCSLHPEFIINDFKIYDIEELEKLFPQFKDKINNFLK